MYLCTHTHKHMLMYTHMHTRTYTQNKVFVFFLKKNILNKIFVIKRREILL